MAEKKQDPPPLSPLQEKEKVLREKLTRLDGMDANEQLRRGIDIQIVKEKTKVQLAEVLKELEKEKATK